MPFTISSHLFLIDFFDGWTGSSLSSRGSWSRSCSPRHTSHVWHSLGHASGSVQLGDDRITHAFQLLLLVVELLNFSQLVSVQPLNSIVALVTDSGLHVEAVRFQAVLGSNFLFLLIIFSLILLGVVDHSFDFFLGKTTLVVGNGDLILFAS